MDELRALIDQVNAGHLSRRRFVQTMVGLGLTAPLAAQMLSSAGVAHAQSKVQYAPTRRGGGGALKLLWWQSPTLLNPHFATGTKDQDGSRIFYEPLAAFDPDGNLVPILAANIKPLGTGPYKYVDFKPGDIVRGELNSTYHMPNRPHFDTIEMKGGGDAVSAGRAVVQTAEYDYAWNMQVEEEIMRRMEQGGRGKFETAPGGNIEHIQCNQTDPWKEVDGERASVKAPHPFLTDPAVRQALNLLVDRASVQEEIYGRGGQATANFLNSPPKYVSKNTRWEFNVDKANQVLDAAGWKRGADGIRAKGDKKLKMVYQTSINAPRQKTQAIVKQAAAKAGIELELKSVTASVFFSSDAANPDIYARFSTDLQMYTTTQASPDPQTFMEQFASWEVAAKDNKYQGRNITRWRNEEYDKLFRAAETELDPAKRAALFIKMNDMVVQNVVVIPVIFRNKVQAVSSRLRGHEISGWDNDTANLFNWFKV